MLETDLWPFIQCVWSIGKSWQLLHVLLQLLNVLFAHSNFGQTHPLKRSGTSDTRLYKAGNPTKRGRRISLKYFNWKQLGRYLAFWKRCGVHSRVHSSLLVSSETELQASIVGPTFATKPLIAVRGALGNMVAVVFPETAWYSVVDIVGKVCWFDITHLLIIHAFFKLLNGLFVYLLACHVSEICIVF